MRVGDALLQCAKLHSYNSLNDLFGIETYLIHFTSFYILLQTLQEKSLRKKILSDSAAEYQRDIFGGKRVNGSPCWFSCLYERYQRPWNLNIETLYIQVSEYFDFNN